MLTRLVAVTPNARREYQRHTGPALFFVFFFFFFFFFLPGDLPGVDGTVFCSHRFNGADNVQKKQQARKTIVLARSATTTWQ